MQYLRTDQYTNIDSGCPVNTDMHTADDVVEIVIGEHRFGEDTLRLVFDDPDTLARLTASFDEARGKLIGHLHGKAQLSPVMSEVDGTAPARW